MPAATSSTPWPVVCARFHGMVPLFSHLVASIPDSHGGQAGEFLVNFANAWTWVEVQSFFTSASLINALLFEI